MKHTAVEWLFEEMSNIHSGAKVYVNANKKIVEQAKKMEKEQIEISYQDGRYAQISDINDTECGRKIDSLSATEYYNETFNKKEL